MNNNFCPWPFSHFSVHENGQLRACCVATPFATKITEVDDLNQWWRNSLNYKELRQSFREDKQHKNCKDCWQQESVGFVSMRKRLLINSTNKVDVDNYHIKDVEITGGRLCNLACRMCSRHSSTLIDKENRPWDGLALPGTEPANWLDDPKEQDKIIDVLKQPQVKDIYFTGGEPQIMPCYQEVLEKLDNIKGLRTMSVHFNTNCTVFNEKFWNLVARFKDRQIDLSIDATESAYESIRYNGSWNKVLDSTLRTCEFLQDIPFTKIHLTIVAQLANLDQAIELQNLYNQITDRKTKNIYSATLLPVTHFPEWEWNNVPLQILEQIKKELELSKGKVIFEFRKMIDLSIERNSFKPHHAAQVLYKEKYFKEKYGVCLWDRRPDWFEIYQSLA